VGQDGRDAAADLPDGASATAAAIWHDGQIAHGAHMQTARQARFGNRVAIPARLIENATVTKSRPSEQAAKSEIRRSKNVQRC
jgi:hypothetical protein